MKTLSEAAPRRGGARRLPARLRQAAAVLAFVGIASGGLLWARQGLDPGAGPLDAHRSLAASLRPAALAGPDPLMREPVIMPVTVALLVSAAARIGDKAGSRALGDRLLAASGGPSPGWGLGFAFDAFADGSTNPPSAIYGTDTAIAAGALLDVFEMTGDDKYLDAAAAALDHYRAMAIRNAKGLFMAYSDQPSDRIPVYANSALLMGAYARVGMLAGRAGFTDLADELFPGRRSEKWETELGAAWPYSAENPFWNDAVNAGAIGFGIAVYSRHRPVPAAELDAVKAYLRSFLRDDDVLEFAPHAKLKPKLLRPTPIFGVGMLMSALAELGDCETARALAGRLGPYRLPEDRFAYLPRDRTYFPRGQAHAVWGLATVERACPHAAGAADPPKETAS
jgi:hypothetical protein